MREAQCFDFDRFDFDVSIRLGFCPWLLNLLCCCSLEEEISFVQESIISAMRFRWNPLSGGSSLLMHSYCPSICPCILWHFTLLSSFLRVDLLEELFVGGHAVHCTGNISHLSAQMCNLAWSSPSTNLHLWVGKRHVDHYSFLYSSFSLAYMTGKPRIGPFCWVMAVLTCVVWCSTCWCP